MRAVARKLSIPAWLVWLIILGLPFAVAGQTILIPMGSVWRYFDSGADLGQAWRSNAYVASAWPAGPAPLGYGEGDEATVLAVGLNPRPITTYLRSEFVLPDPPGINALTLRLVCDDAAAVYLNGAEVYRKNLPAGPLHFQTGASEPVDGAAERRVHQYVVSPYLTVAGTNVVAVELHQFYAGLHDARFDLELIANIPLTLPEIRLVSPTNGQVLSPGDVRLQVETSDRDGFVYWVRYFSNGTVIGESFEEPFGFVWSSPPTGRYRVTAEAIDNSGRRRESAPVYFQVGNVTGTSVLRGPYLQSGSTTSIVVRWRTDWPADSLVRYGTGPQDLDWVATGPTGVEHEVKLTGLSPDTVYYYTVGTAAGPLMGGAGPDFRFRTATLESKPLRIWAIGDSGTANAPAAAVRNAYADSTDRTDVWLMLGDNAYESGTDDQYQRAVFDMYPAMLRSTVLWPTLGNHDSGSTGVIEDFPYLEIFTLPKNGEAGGLASGTELYYSFDQANVHFICLDSTSSDRSPGSPMLTWLENDLASSRQEWLVAYWHHPPYSWGTHNSDVERDLIEMRTNVGPILERYGVDLVLSGHSHVYERSFLLNGHHGPSTTLSPAMVLDAGDGTPFGDGAYRKPSGGLGANQGAVYVVCGCSGEGGNFPFLRHPAMAKNRAGFGSMVIDVSGLRMEVRFITDSGMIADWFALDKAGPGPLVAPRLQIRSSGSGVELAWPVSETLFRLENCPGFEGAAHWETILQVPEVVGRWNRMWREQAGTNRFFRLRSSP